VEVRLAKTENALLEKASKAASYVMTI